MAELERTAALQKTLLWAAVWLLRPGGTLVYSTCTFDPLEVGYFTT
jgi:16S rRNA C967 or C1407 C5-methylase (RsmB/RsmF family)